MISPSPITRRKFLGVGLAGGALLAIGGGVAAWFTAGYDALLSPTDVPIALSTKEFAVVRALIDALFPGGHGLPSGNAIGLAQRVDEELWAASPKLRRQLKQGIQLLEHVPVLFGYPGRFTALSPSQREEVFTKLLRSNRRTYRQIAVALKQLTQLYYFADERTWRAIHYPGTLGPLPRPPDSHLVYQRIVRSRRRAT